MKMPKIRVSLEITRYLEIEIDSAEFINDEDHNMNGIIQFCNTIRDNPKPFIEDAITYADGETCRVLGDDYEESNLNIDVREDK